MRLGLEVHDILKHFCGEAVLCVLNSRRERNICTNLHQFIHVPQPVSSNCYCITFAITNHCHLYMKMEIGSDVSMLEGDTNICYDQPHR